MLDYDFKLLYIIKARHCIASRVTVWVVLWLSVLPLQSVAQIIREPPRGGLSKDDYLSMVIDSLSFAEETNDTANIINYAATLATNFQGLTLIDRSASYLNMALRFASEYSDHRWYPDVCNRVGMLMAVCGGERGTATYRQMIDSSFFWYRRAISRAEAIKEYQIAGWGYRGMLFNAVYLTDDKAKKDSALYYYNEGTHYAIQANDTQLLTNCHKHYGYYLYGIGDMVRVDSLLKAQNPRLDEMTPRQRHDFHRLIHDYLASANRLDTLVKLRQLTENFMTEYLAGVHRDELYSKDQKYEVSKTKNSLYMTTNQLATTNRRLIGAFIALGTFVIVLIYLISLSFKNRRLISHNELLLREQNHRVKNNLQMISSLFTTQLDQMPSSMAREILEDNQRRIGSIALLHRMLYNDGNVERLDTATYFKSLAEEVRYSASRPVDISVDVPAGVTLKIEKLTSLGLILNELMTNSIRHVATDVALYIIVSLTVNNDSIRLSYADNGQGVSHDVWHSHNSFGNQLIQLQSRQLRGEFEIRTHNGFAYDLLIAG